MKIRILSLLLATLLLCACGTQPAETLPPPETVPPTDTIPEETQPLHSPLYLPDCSTEQFIEYFNEVVLDMEYSDGVGDVTLVQKWGYPLTYMVFGEPTEEDLAVLENLCAQLNAIPGFPGIYPAENAEQMSLEISFFGQEQFREEFYDAVRGEDAYGATQFWYYTDTNELYHGRIGLRTDISQAERSSIIVEEVINTLGITDTVLREDSIVYQHSNENLTLSDVDWVILKLLYDPAMEAGMDEAACAQVIRQLYY